MAQKERITVHLTPDLFKEIEKHRIQDRPKAEPAERILRRLLLEHENPVSLAPLPISCPGDRQLSFRASPEVWEMIDGYSQEHNLSIHASSLALLGHAVKRPVLEPMDIEGFYRYLWDSFGQSDRLIKLYDIFEDPGIWKRIPRYHLYRFLEKLHEEKRIRLITPLFDEDIDPRLDRAPSLTIKNQKHRCDRLELKPNLSCSRINESSFRRQIYHTPSWAAAHKITKESGRRVSCISQQASVRRSEKLIGTIQKEWVLIASLREDSAIAMSLEQASSVLGYDIKKSREFNLRTITWRNWVQEFGFIIDDLHDGEIDACRLVLRDEDRTEIALISIQALDNWSRKLAEAV